MILLRFKTQLIIANLVVFEKGLQSIIHLYETLPLQGIVVQMKIVLTDPTEVNIPLHLKLVMTVMTDLTEGGTDLCHQIIHDMKRNDQQPYQQILTMSVSHLILYTKKTEWLIHVIRICLNPKSKLQMNHQNV